MRQEPVGLLVVAVVVHAALPSRMAAVEHLRARHEAELLGQVGGSVALARVASIVAPVRRRTALAGVVDAHQRLPWVGGVGADVADVEVERLGLPEARPVQQQRDQHVAPVVPSADLEAPEEQVCEAFLREGRRLAPVHPGRALRPCAVARDLRRGVGGPGVAQEGPVAPVLVGRLVAQPIEGAARVARVDGGRGGPHLGEPVEEVGKVRDDVLRIHCRARRPRQPAGVQAGLAVEGAGVEALGEVLEQVVGVALRRVALQVFEEHAHRARHLAHPHEAAVVAAGQEVVQQWLHHAGRRQQDRQLGAGARLVGVDLRLGGDEHQRASSSRPARATLRRLACGSDSVARRADSSSPTSSTCVVARVMAV